MKTLFTIHAGEFLVASKIKEEIQGGNVWVPVADLGVDLLVTDTQNKRTISLQVKSSRGYEPKELDEGLRNNLKGCGWWHLERRKIQNSKADFWAFVVLPIKGVPQYILISPGELERRLTVIHGTRLRWDMYLWVTDQEKCWETRGLGKPDLTLVATNQYSHEERGFTEYLNCWSVLKRKLSSGTR
ncbi:MAG: hypothetical protein HY330_05210 [Chloroflexi bacterium]|nr:hypothetical protein [Chloroflexota bacterium]